MACLVVMSHQGSALAQRCVGIAPWLLVPMTKTSKLVEAASNTLWLCSDVALHVALGSSGEPRRKRIIGPTGDTHCKNSLSYRRLPDQQKSSEMPTKADISIYDIQIHLNDTQMHSDGIQRHLNDTHSHSESSFPTLCKQSAFPPYV